MFEKFPNKTENKGEILTKRARKLFIIWVMSALASFTPMKNTNAQSLENKDKSINMTETVVTPSKEFAEDIKEQKTPTLQNY
jgi:hypothetical protein